MLGESQRSISQEELPIIKIRGYWGGMLAAIKIPNDQGARLLGGLARRGVRSRLHLDRHVFPPDMNPWADLNPRAVRGVRELLRVRAHGSMAV